MDKKEVNMPVAIAIAAIAVVLVLIAGVFFVNRKPAVPSAEQSKRAQFEQMYGGKH